MLLTSQLQHICDALHDYGATPADFFTSLFARRDETQENGEAARQEISAILDGLENTSIGKEVLSKRAHRLMMKSYASQILTLVQRDAGFHFMAKKTSEQQLREFTIDELAVTMQRLAPDVWELFGVLLAADPRANYKREWRRRHREQSSAKTKPQMRNDGEIDMQDVGDSDDEYWIDIDEPLVENDDDEPEDVLDHIRMPCRFRAPDLFAEMYFERDNKGD